MKFLDNLADVLSDIAAIERATAKIVLSTVLLLLALGIPVGAYFAGKALWLSQPAWLRWLWGRI